MPKSKPKCSYCKQDFDPDPRVSSRQKRCAREECSKAANCKKQRKWVALHLNYAKDRQAKMAAWAHAYPAYWKNYRATHPEYVKRDNERRKRALQKQRRSAKLTSIQNIAFSKLNKLTSSPPSDCSAKLTESDRRLNGIVEYLLWRVKVPCSAKLTQIDLNRFLE